MIVTFFDRICVEAALPTNVALQIDCYCNTSLGDRQTMHVQGLSHWAQANIGPYSQCVQVRFEGYVTLVYWNLQLSTLKVDQHSVLNGLSHDVLAVK